jgi:uncharacterized protein (DUF924 family)
MTEPAVPRAAQEVLDFWLDEVGPKGWYGGGEALDSEIRDRWAEAWACARKGGLEKWLASPEGALAYIILTDQFPRNIFREDGRAFATDPLALNAAQKAIHRRWDLRLPEPGRQFFYLPLMHSESQSDQDRCVRLMITRMPEGGASNLLHARAHREVIRRFGRFPYRNAALGRSSTGEETRFLDAGGYPTLVRELEAA